MGALLALSEGAPKNVALMPEGDTIFRTAAVMRRWLLGREITAARAHPSTGLAAGVVARLVGETVEEVEARGKHLLVRCSGGVAVHTHMQMTGSWHVYSAGDRWRRPGREARLVIECRERLAVCFNAPVVELIDRRAESLHPGLRGLGPDVLRPPIDLTEVRRRVAAQPRRRTIADVLLDQTVVAGIGNIWRAESLFAEQVHPATPAVDLDGATLDRLVSTAARLMQRSSDTTLVPGGRRRPWVYRRTGRPCPRCGAAIASAPFENGRTVYWCPRCQPTP